MTDKLPANLLALFQPRPPLRYLPPCDHGPEQRRTPYVTGIAQFLEELRKPDPEYAPTESIMQKRERLREEKKNVHHEKIETSLKNYKPAEDPQIRGDPYKTLFVARLSYDVKEPDLEREFGRFGPIERIRIVRNKDPKANKPNRGYAFIVYEREKDMKAAYKETDGIRIKDRRVLVDVERGRTVKGWKPRRLGGGLGGRGYTKAPATRPTGPSGFGDRGFRGGSGGFRGGFQGGRGGFRGGGGGGGFGGNRFDGPRGPRGGIGYQGGGSFGDRGGYPNGGHEAPPNAPTGPGGGRFQGSGGDRGYGASAGGYSNGTSSGYRGSSSSGGGGGYGGRSSGGGYDRDGHGHGHDRHGSGRDDGRSGGYGRDSSGYAGSRYNDDSSRKRPHDGDGYGGGSGGDPRRRRY